MIATERALRLFENGIRVTVRVLDDEHCAMTCPYFKGLHFEADCRFFDDVLEADRIGERRCRRCVAYEL